MLKKAVAVLIICVCILTGCGRLKESEIGSIIGTDKMETEYYRATYVIDEDNLTEVTSYSNYIFVGTIVSYQKTEYIGDDMPITYYSVQVKNNIKGELTTEEEIVLVKAGGLSKDRKVFLYNEKDILPAEGKTYVFAATIFNDELYCPCPNMVALIENTDQIENDETYKEYVETCQTISETVTPVEGISRYDVNNK